jgi:hypothetical protein
VPRESLPRRRCVSALDVQEYPRFRRGGNSIPQVLDQSPRSLNQVPIGDRTLGTASPQGVLALRATWVKLEPLAGEDLTRQAAPVRRDSCQSRRHPTPGTPGSNY